MGISLHQSFPCTTTGMYSPNCATPNPQSRSWFAGIDNRISRPLRLVRPIGFWLINIRPPLRNFHSFRFPGVQSAAERVFPSVPSTLGTNPYELLGSIRVGLRGYHDVRATLMNLIDHNCYVALCLLVLGGGLAVLRCSWAACELRSSSSGVQFKIRRGIWNIAGVGTPIEPPCSFNSNRVNRLICSSESCSR